MITNRTGVRFPKASLANYGRKLVEISIELYWKTTELATIVG